MQEVLNGILISFAMIVGLATVVSFLVGAVMLPLCLVQLARGFRPWRTFRLLLSGIILLGTFAGYLVNNLDHAKGIIGGLSTVVSCLAGLWGVLCLLLSVFVNMTEINGAKK